MSGREYIISQLDTLPESVIEMIQRLIYSQKCNPDLFDNDTDYLSSIPGMVDSIKAAAAEPLADGVPASEVDFGA